MADDNREPEGQKPSHWDQLRERTSEIVDVRREMTERASPFARFSDVVGNLLGSPTFFATLLLLHGLWLLFNIRIWPWDPIDPYPFVFLATMTSLEAPFIALLILINQRRRRGIDEVREEVDLRVSLHSERQMSMMVRMLDDVRKSLGVTIEEDPDYLEEMKRDLDPHRLMESVEQDLEEDEASAVKGEERE